MPVGGDLNLSGRTRRALRDARNKIEGTTRAACVSGADFVF